MNKIDLNPKTLLGFKIIATGESSATLQSPKIGGKSCTVVDGEITPARMSPLAAKIGTKLP